MGDVLSENMENGAKEAAKAVEEATDSIGNSAKKAEKTSLASSVAIGNAMTMVADKAIDMVAHMVDVTVDYDGALDQLQASTGANAQEMERYAETMNAIYSNNYGESFTDIADAIALVSKNMGDMNSDAIQMLTEDAFTLRDVFQYDIAESTRAAKAMMDSFGLSGEDAMNLIAAGAQNGLDYSGELLDSISEYSVQFSKVGMDADEMFHIFQMGMESGAFNLDKIGDAIKELSVRVVDGSETTAEGFSLLGLNADEMAAQFAAGGDQARIAFAQTLEALTALEDPLTQNTAGVALFGTMWEDLGAEDITALSEISGNAYDTTQALSTMQEVKYDNLGSMLEALKRQFELLLIPLGEAIIPLFSQLVEAILPVLTALLTPLTTALQAVIEPILGIIDVLNPLIEVIGEILTPMNEGLALIFTEVFGRIAADVSDVIPYVTGLLQGLVDFVAGVFTGDWSRAWQGVVDIFENLVGGIGNIIKIPLNWVIEQINDFIQGLNNIQIPDWVPVVGGKGFHIAQIPRLKAGIDYVPSDFYPAFLDKGEMVLTAEEARAYRNIGQNRVVSSNMYSSGATEVRITVPLYMDSREVARATAWWTGEQLSWEEM